MRPQRHRDVELRGALQALRAVAGRVRLLTVEERELAGEIEALTRKLAPQLLDQPGVGPLAAAQILISWSTVASRKARAAARQAAASSATSPAHHCRDPSRGSRSEAAPCPQIRRGA
jgi:transposase